MDMASEKQVMIVALDDGEQSKYALNWTLDHFFSPIASISNPLFKLVVIHCKPSAAMTVGFAGPGASAIMPIVDVDSKCTAAEVVETAKQLCENKSVNGVSIEILEGDAKIGLCGAVEKHHASILVLGSHCYGAVKRAVLGSVSDYCAHNAQCTVMIVKKPQLNH